MARKITTKAEKFIDEKLVSNGLAQQAIKNKDARSVMLLAAQACVGVKESGGNNKGDMVEEFQKTVDNYAYSEAWCMAFVETMIAYAEKKTGVISPIFFSEHCLTVWRKTPTKMRVKNYPAPGAIIIWQHGSSESGHTGFVSQYLDAKSTTMKTLEGNTGSNMREGDGVYLKTRSTKIDGDMKVVGYLIPFEKVEEKPEPVEVNRIALSWESSSYPARKGWSDFLTKHVSDNLSDYEKAKDLVEFYPDFKSFSASKKVKAICEIIVGVCEHESDFNPTSRMIETTMGIDPITGRQVASEGLLQLSYQDVKSYGSLLKGCGIDWSKDKDLSDKDPKKTIFNPIFNLDAGTRILKNQIVKRGSITLSSNVYWSVLKIGGRYSKISAIKARVKKYV